MLQTLPLRHFTRIHRLELIRVRVGELPNAIQARQFFLWRNLYNGTINARSIRHPQRLCQISHLSNHKRKAAEHSKLCR